MSSSTSMISMASSSGAVFCAAGRSHSKLQVAQSGNGQIPAATTSSSSTSLKNANSVHRTGNPLECATQSVQRVQRRSLLVRASTTGGRDLYQPFRPPPKMVQVSVGVKSVDEMLQVLRDKEGLWFEYASVIPLLTRSGYSPSEIDEATGINGHEQNKLVVGSQVRSSLVSSGFDKDKLSWFDNGGAEILYELRTLSAQQRRAAAEYILDRNMDGKGAHDVARAVKDFDRRRAVVGWESFSATPGDCLAFSYLRMSKDSRSASEMESVLKQGLEYVETESARKELERALNMGKPESVEEKIGKAAVTIMRLSSEKIPVVLPVCEFSSQSVAECPSSPVFERDGRPFAIHKASISWQTFVSVPGWEPIVEAVAPVAISLPNSELIPKQSGIKNYTEPTLLVVDKGNRNVVPSSYFLVDGEEGLSLKAGPEIAQGKYTVLGTVLIALRPPVPDDPNGDEGDW